MGWHNHEENIKKAKLFISAFKDNQEICFSVGAGNNLIELLQSMIEDAETGHKRIKELEKDMALLEKANAALVAEINLLQSQNSNLRSAFAPPESQLEHKTYPKPPLDCQALPRLLQENHELKEEVQNLKDTIRYLRNELEKS